MWPAPSPLVYGDLAAFNTDEFIERAPFGTAAKVRFHQNLHRCPNYQHGSGHHAFPPPMKDIAPFSWIEAASISMPTINGSLIGDRDRNR
jgi:hypothetical protein